MEDKKICIIADNISNYRYISDLSIRLSKKNAVTMVFINHSMDKDKSLIDLLDKNKIEQIYLEDIEVYTGCDDFTDEIHNISYKIYTYLKKMNYDYIHFDDMNGIAFCSLQSKKTTSNFENTQITVSINNNTKYNLEKSNKLSANPIGDIKKIYFEKYSYKNADKLLLINEDFLKWCLSNNYELNVNNIISLEEFIEYNVFNNLLKPKDNVKNKIQKQNPLVSVCVSHYNYGKYLPFTLESIKESSYENFEVIIVDDESDEEFSIETFKKLEKEYAGPNWKFFKKIHGGASETKNYAASQAKGEFLLFVDGDDIEFCDTISAFLYGIYKSNSDCLTSYFQNFTGGGEMNKTNTGNTVIIPGPILELTAIENVFGACNFMVKREVFHEIGGFPNKDRIYEDWAFFFRLNFLGYKMDTVPLTLFGYRRKDNSRSSTSNKVECLYNTVKYYYEFIPKHLINLFDILIISNNNVF